MAGSLQYVSLRRLQVVLGLVVFGLLLAPSASSAAQLDTVAATGMAGPNPIVGWEYYNINISASSDISGQGATGTASFVVNGDQSVSGPVTCLSVTGPDQGGGTAGSPTTAVLNLIDSNSGVVTVQLVDNGGNGGDIVSSLPAGRAASDCSPFTQTVPYLTSTMTAGRATVLDAVAESTTAGFTTNPSPSTVGAPVTFDASSSTCAAAPCSYVWSDGAHSLGNGISVSFTFRYVGVKHVLLTVTDAGGGQSSVQHDLQVSAPATAARFTTSPSPSTVGTPVTFDASSSTCAAAPCSYAWSDGAHGLGNGTSVSFTFHYVGVKHVLLTLTDASGGKSSVQNDLQVGAQP